MKNEQVLEASKLGLPVGTRIRFKCFSRLGMVMEGKIRRRMIPSGFLLGFTTHSQNGFPGFYDVEAWVSVGGCGYTTGCVVDPDDIIAVI